MKSVNFKAIVGSCALLAVTATMLFVSAGTFNYWQTWVFLLVFFGSAFAITIQLMKNDPRLLERRIKAGPLNEKETSQKIIQSIAQLSFILVIILPALDHRFGWSIVPSYISIMGDILVLIGFYIVSLVFKENTYASALIEVDGGQKVISTGTYAWIRHPMYTGALILILRTPLALGSWWGLLTLVLFIFVLIWRLLDEERVLARDLPGYIEYEKKVTYRLVPYLW